MPSSLNPGSKGRQPMEGQGEGAREMGGATCRHRGTWRDCWLASALACVLGHLASSKSLHFSSLQAFEDRRGGFEQQACHRARPGLGQAPAPMVSAWPETGGRGSRMAVETGSPAGGGPSVASGGHQQRSSVLRLSKEKPKRAAASSHRNRSGSVTLGSGKSHCPWRGGWGSPFERQENASSLF